MSAENVSPQDERGSFGCHYFFRRFNDREIRLPDGPGPLRRLRNQATVNTAAPKAKAETNSALPPADLSFGTATAWLGSSKAETARVG